MRNTLYENAWKEGRKEGANKIKNEIKTLIKKGTLPSNTLELLKIKD